MILTPVTTPKTLWQEGIVAVTDRDPWFCPLHDPPVRIDDLEIDRRTIAEPDEPPFTIANAETLGTCQGIVKPCGHQISEVRREYRRQDLRRNG